MVCDIILICGGMFKTPDYSIFRNEDHSNVIKCYCRHPVGRRGQGKIIDIMAAKADVVVRSSGGNNAGHTVVHGDQVYKLHLLPSGILYPETLCLIGSGVVVDPAVLLEEIKNMNERGVTCDNLRIDARADIIILGTDFSTGCLRSSRQSRPA